MKDANMLNIRKVFILQPKSARSWLINKITRRSDIYLNVGPPSKMT